MIDFFRVLPLQVGSLTPRPRRARHGRRRRARHPGLVAVGPDLPDPLDRALGRHRGRPVYRSRPRSARRRSPVSSEVRRTMSPHDPSIPHVRRTGQLPPSGAAAPPARCDCLRSARVGRRRPPVPDPVPHAATASARRSVVSSPIALVAVLAGGALFMSGYSLGRQSAVEPGTPVAEAGAFGRSGTRTTPSPTGTPAARSTRGPRAGRDQGDDRGARRPVLVVPHARTSTAQSLQGISGQFEGIGAEIASQAPDGTQGCATLGPDLPARDRHADRRVAGARRPACARRPRPRRRTACRSTA